MKRFAALNLAIVALLAIATAVSSTASAFLLETLPEKPGRALAGENIGATSLETVGGTSLRCTSISGEGTEETSKPPSGTFHALFSKCETLKPVKGLVCTGEGDAAGDLLLLGTWKLVFDKNPTGELRTAVLTMYSPGSFSCGAGSIAVSYKGDMLCLALNPTVKSTTHEGHCIQTNGKAEETKYWTTTGEEKAIAVCLISINGGAFEETGELGLGSTTTTEEVVADQ